MKINHQRGIVRDGDEDPQVILLYLMNIQMPYIHIRTKTTVIYYSRQDIYLPSSPSPHFLRSSLLKNRRRLLTLIRYKISNFIRCRLDYIRGNNNFGQNPIK